MTFDRPDWRGCRVCFADVAVTEHEGVPMCWACAGWEPVLDPIEPEHVLEPLPSRYFDRVPWHKPWRERVEPLEHISKHFGVERDLTKPQCATEYIRGVEVLDLGKYEPRKLKR